MGSITIIAVPATPTRRSIPNFQDSTHRLRLYARPRSIHPQDTPETHMDATDAAELISEIREERAVHEADDKFRDRAALLIALLAMLLAIGSLGGGNVAEDMIHNNIKASDTWAFFQAKNVRQTQYRLAADELETQLANPGLTPEVRAALQAKVDAYRATVARYDDEPDPTAPTDSLRGEGKKQLSAR